MAAILTPRSGIFSKARVPATAAAEESEASNYSLASCQDEQKDVKDVKIVRGKWHHGKNPSIPNEHQQTEEDRTIEHKWKRYIETKQIKKAERKQ